MEDDKRPGVRVEAIAGPGSAAQLLECRDRAGRRHDDVREVDRPALVAVALQHRSCHQGNRGLRLPPEADIGKATDEGEVPLTFSELVERLASDQFSRL